MKIILLSVVMGALSAISAWGFPWNLPLVCVGSAAAGAWLALREGRA